MGMLFFSGFLNIVWEYIEIDVRWKFARRDFLKKRPQQIIFCWRFSKPFFWWTVRLPLAKDAKVSINRLIDYVLYTAWRNSTLFVYFSLLPMRKFFLAVRKIFNRFIRKKKLAREPNFGISSGRRPREIPKGSRANSFSSEWTWEKFVWAARKKFEHWEKKRKINEQIAFFNLGGFSA